MQSVALALIYNILLTDSRDWNTPNTTRCVTDGTVLRLLALLGGVEGGQGGGGGGMGGGRGRRMSDAGQVKVSVGGVHQEMEGKNSRKRGQVEGIWWNERNSLYRPLCLLD